jgi:hypothetical protein
MVLLQRIRKMHYCLKVLYWNIGICLKLKVEDSFSSLDKFDKNFKMFFVHQVTLPIKLTDFLYGIKCWCH